MFFGPGDTHGGRGGPRLRIYYESRKIKITSSYVDTRGRRTPIAAIRGAERCLTYRYPLFKVAVITGGIEVLISVVLAVAQDSVLLLGGGVVAAAGMVLGAWADARRNPRFMAVELWQRGRPVTLFSTRDKQEFGQVTRALVRALEDSEE